MSKTKILFFIPQLVSGGAERVSINIMKALDKSIFDVHLVITTTKYSVYERLPEGVTVHNLHTLKTSASIFSLRKLLYHLRPSIVFSSLIRGHIALNMAMVGFKKKPYLILRSPNSPKLLLQYNQIGKIENFFLERAYRHADMVLAQTPEMKEEMIKYHQISKENIAVFINPIDSDLIDNKTKQITTPFKADAINVVAAGRIVYQKGFDILIQSFKRVVEYNASYRLYIIGEGSSEEISDLQHIIDTLELTQNIEFLGYQENPYRYYYFSDLYVLSSRWEGLPNTVLENLYLKKPVIATRCIPYMETLIKEGENGLLVDVEDVYGLAEAILNYKKIAGVFSPSNNDVDAVNCFFKNLSTLV